MDLLKRISREEEWEIGASYQELRNGVLGRIYTCVAVKITHNNKRCYHDSGLVSLQSHETGKVYHFNRVMWRIRFVKYDAEKGKRVPVPHVPKSNHRGRQPR